ncbi:MAG: hypothetical protein WDZ41_04680 [Candidatus Babeliales bacterium]
MKNQLFFLFLFNLSGVVFAFERSIEVKPFEPKEEIKEPTSSLEAKNLAERLKETQEEARKTREQIDEAKSQLEQKEILNISEKEIEELQKQLEQNKKLAKAYEKKAKAEQDILKKPEIKKLLKEYEEQLAEQEEPAYEVPLGESLEEFEKSFQQGTQNKSAEQINLLRNGIETSVDIDVINESLNKTRNINEKYKIIDEKQEQLKEIKELVDGELQKVATDPSISQNYKIALHDLRTTITEKLEELNILNLQLDEQQLGFIARIARNLKDWFDRTFDFHKESVKKRSIEDELALMKEKQKDIEQVNRLYSDIQQLQNNAAGLVKTINLDIQQPAVIKQSFNKHRNEANKVLKELNILEKKASAYEPIIEDAYTDLQELTGHFQAKAERYKEKEYPTLFDKLFKKYQIELEEEYAPDQVYQALGFDPGIDPKTISQEEILQASEQLQEAFRGIVRGKAARNAGVLLRDSIARETYDTFLKDYRSLKQKGMDPSKTNEAATRYLNQDGELSKLQISESLHNKIINEALPLLIGEALPDAGVLRAQNGKFPLIRVISQVQEALSNALENAQKTIQKIPQEGPPGF